MLRITYKRLGAIGSALLFIATFEWIYRHWTSPTWSYMGLTYTDPGIAAMAFAYFVAVLPSTWMPITLRRPSQVIYWVLYAMVFVPSSFLPLYMNLQSREESMALMIVLLGGMWLIGMAYRVPPLALPRFVMPATSLLYAAAIVFVALNLIVLSAFRGSLQLVSFSDVYSLRSAGKSILEEHPIAGYAITWLSSTANPLLMATGLMKRRRVFYAIGAADQIFLYATAGQKAFLLSVLLLPLFYLLLKREGTNWGTRMMVGICAASVVVYMLVTEWPDGPLFILASLLFSRTFAAQGYITGWFFDFFHHNPHTYFGHIHVISDLVGSPYRRNLGEEVAQYYMGRMDVNLNANFWASDGIASIGLPGVILVSILVAIVFLLIDSAARFHDRKTIALALSFAAINCGNWPLFTLVLSGGIAILVIVMMIAPSEFFSASESPRALTP